MSNKEIIDKLNKEKRLPISWWERLIANYTKEDFEYAREVSQGITKKHFDNKIFFRGIIEFTNICKNNCLYCGIRSANKDVFRYRLSFDEIMECCVEGFNLGYRTFVLQGGEDIYFTDDKIALIVGKIKSEFPECAITLSIGEREKKAYQKFFVAGADRYLLRHETADVCHYKKIHPPEMIFENRIKCLYDLKDIGYQVGCGMMVGSPYQTIESLAKDMEFMSEFNPHMVGIGPFIPHSKTPFRDYPSGDINLTVFLISLIRIMLPSVLLPATTALGTVEDNGRIKGVMAGCNVVMPNLSPKSVRGKYLLYDNKAGVKLSAKESLDLLKNEMQEGGYELIIDRGDSLKNRRGREEG